MSESSTPESVMPSANPSPAAANGSGPEAPYPPDSGADRETVKGLLREARNTREVLVAFKSAIESGTYAGAKMLALAKGLAFLDAILNQNKAHIINLQAQADK